MLFEKQMEKIYRSKMFNRCDDKGMALYFSAEDFPSLQRYSYPFVSKLGHKLQGYFYTYSHPNADRLIVFEHGMGGGHRSYMREIERLAKAGYLVFAYDHTGCMESGGEGTNGFAQSLCDLDDCLQTLKQENSLKGRTLSVVGHSWGAFSTMNIPALHPDVTHVVAMCGFVSVKDMIEQNFGGILKGYRKGIYALETRTNPNYVKFNAVESLKNTNARVLLIYSADDQLVKKEVHYNVLLQALSGKENIHFLLEQGKGHNPNYTADAVACLGEYMTNLARKAKKLAQGTVEERKAFVDGFDWWRMTEQDDAVWNVILETLGK